MARRRITTPPPPVAVATAVASLASKARQTVRLHPRQGNAPVDATKIGGTILWPQREPWPTCAEHDCPYVVGAQIRKQDVPEITFRRNTDLLHVLWCPNDHGYYACPEVAVFWRSSRIRGHSPDCAGHAKAEEQYVPTPCVVHPERLTEFPDGAELPQEEFNAIEASEAISDALTHLGAEPFGHWRVPDTNTGLYYSWLSVAFGTKVGGYPHWVQDPEYPTCDAGHPMEFLMSFGSREFDGASWGRWLPIDERELLTEPYALRSEAQSAMGCSFGDAGHLYLFICRQCPEWPISAFTQSC